MLAALGCGSDNHTGDPTAAVAACNAYCHAYIAAQCTDGFYLTEDECKSYECGDIATSPSTCFSRFKAYYDCTNVLSNADLCADTACDTQYKALLGCSGG
jgi:hypothetical protein